MGASRHGVSAMPWPQLTVNDGDVDNDVDGGGEGIVILLLVRVKKRKVRRAKIFHQRKNGGKNKSNYPDDKPAWKKINYYYYYSEDDEERV